MYFTKMLLLLQVERFEFRVNVETEFPDLEKLIFDVNYVLLPFPRCNRIEIRVKVIQDMNSVTSETSYLMSIIYFMRMLSSLLHW